ADDASSGGANRGPRREQSFGRSAAAGAGRCAGVRRRVHRAEGGRFQVAVRHRPQRGRLAQQRAAILFGGAAGERPDRRWRRGDRGAPRKAVQGAFPGLGRSGLQLRPARLAQGAGLWFLRSAGKAAVRARHLAGDLAAALCRQVAGRGRDRHHGNGRVGPERHPWHAAQRRLQPCQGHPARRAEAGAHQLFGLSPLPARLAAGLHDHRGRRPRFLPRAERPAGRRGGLAFHPAVSADPERRRGGRLGRAEGDRQLRLSAADDGGLRAPLAVAL
ncbi:MAG: GH16, partial [uncultured Sphingomonas sp.]